MSKRDEYINLLGKTARDRVTGHTGVICTIGFDLFGCVQAVVKPPVDKDGKQVDGVWLDVNRLEILGNDRVMPVPSFAPVPQKHDHGPADKPKSRAQ